MADRLGYSDEETFKIALEKARQYCASDEHCLRDVKQKLLRCGCTSVGINSILQLLTEEDFINESRYALAFANGKFNLFRWGKNKIASELRMKKIPEQLIHKALGNIDTIKYRECLNTLLEKKKHDLAGEKPAVMKQKLLRFALQKGYEAELVYDVLRMNDE